MDIREEKKLLENSLNYLNMVGQNPCNTSKYLRLKIVFVCVYQSITGTLILMETFYNWKGVETLGNAAETFPAVYQVISRNIIMALLHNKFLNLINSMDLFWRSDRYGTDFQKEMQAPLIFLNKIFNFFRYVVITTLVVYFFKPIFTATRVYPAAWYSICDIDNNVCYFSGCIWQAFNTYIIYVVVIGCDGLVFYLLIRVFCELKFIIHGLESLDVKVKIDGDCEEVLRDIRELVRHHNFILSFIKDLNNIYSLLLLNLFWTCMVSICVGIFLLTIDGLPPSFAAISRYLPYLMTFHLQTLCYCLGGELIKHQTEMIFHATYNSNWHLKKHPRYTKYVQIIMVKSMFPEIIKIGGVWDLNVQTFTSILKTSMSILTAMQTFNGK